MSLARSPASRSQTGMTLVEVTVAAVIFSLIMTAVVTAMRMFGQTYHRLQLVTTETTQKREVDRFLRQLLYDALPESGYFDGSADFLEWVAPVDRIGSAGGLQHVRLAARGSELELSFAPFDRLADPQDEPDWNATIKPVALLSNLDRFEVAYRIAPLEDWSSSFSSADGQSDLGGLPWAVQLTIETNDVTWPPLIVAFEQHELRL